MFWRLLILLPMLHVLPQAHAAPGGRCERSSPPHTVALIELYTSEGCSSCPPADRWLSTLVSRFGPNQLIPLSLHVDYWDYIGWRDPFAQPKFSERQRRLAKISGGGTIYTPEVFAGMRELRGWHDAAGFERRLREINRQPARADITLSAYAGAERSLNVDLRVTLPPKVSEAQAVLVLFEDQLVSSVSRGENRGVTLPHDHVVRYWSPPFPLVSAAGEQTFSQPLKLAADWNSTKLGLVAFVQDVRTGEVLQAVSMPACAPAAK